MHLLHSLLPFFIVTASVCASLDVQPGSGLHKRHNHVAHNRVVARPFGNERRSRLKRAVPNKPQRCRSKKAQNTLTSTVAPETTSAAEPVNTPAPTSEPADVEIEAKKKTSTSAKPKETSGGDSGGSGGGKGKFTGEATFYDTGLTACGITNKDSDFIAAVAASRFDSFPGAGANPNNNPICKKKVRAFYEGKSVDVIITDRCVGCAFDDLDFSRAAFAKLASFDKGRLEGMTWDFI
ncbi:hypothetical protein FRC03_006966 [Tulasnella sp. 419]|nr:hypothetical protein FRC03_006966 [Tulasnella sp. 419]